MASVCENAMHELTENRAIPMLNQLGAAYKKPNVQRKMKQLMQNDSTEELSALIRSVLEKTRILPKYGFEESPQGAEQMMLALRNALVSGSSEMHQEMKEQVDTLRVLEQLAPATPGFLTSEVRGDAQAQAKQDPELDIQEASTSPQQTVDIAAQDVAVEQSTNNLEDNANLEAVQDTSIVPKIAQIVNEAQFKECLVNSVNNLGDLVPQKTTLVQLTESRAMAMLDQIYQAFNKPKFQKKKKELAFKNGYLNGYAEMVITELNKILPRFGFEQDFKGVSQMKLTLAHLLLSCTDSDSEAKKVISTLKKLVSMQPTCLALVADRCYAPAPDLPPPPRGPVPWPKSRRPTCEAEKYPNETEAPKARNASHERVQTSVSDGMLVTKFDVTLLHDEPRKMQITVRTRGEPLVSDLRKDVAAKLGCEKPSELQVVQPSYNKDGVWACRLDSEGFNGYCHHVTIGRADVLRAAAAGKKPSFLTRLKEMIDLVTDTLDVE